MADTTSRPGGAIALMGPTASGKTALAMALADYLPCDIISVDSAQVYRGMDIGTAKPDKATLRRYPHALVDLLGPEESYSVARFREDARAAMQVSLDRGRVPLLVGGTMLYFKALLYGIDELPAADAELRADIERQGMVDGWPAVHARLAACDPVAAGRISPHDPQRLQRALEVYLVSGRSLTEWQSQAETGPAHKQRGAPMALDLPCAVLPLALAPLDRAVLHRRISERFHLMLGEGLVEEARALRERCGVHADLPSMRCVGYRQVLAYLDGDYSYDAMVERGVIATRQLAKRQLTWLRSWQDLHRIWVDELGRRVLQPVSVANLSPLQAALHIVRKSSKIDV